MIEKIFRITEDESGVPIDAKCVGEVVRCANCKYRKKVRRGYAILLVQTPRPSCG